MTPNIWSEADKAKMREAAVNHMDDVGQRLKLSAVRDSFGSETKAWLPDGKPTPCGIETHEGREFKSKIVTVTYEMTIRLPYDYEIDAEDRFKITNYRGDEVDWEYELITPIRHGISAIRVGVRKLEH